MSTKRILKQWENPVLCAAEDETPSRDCLSFRETSTPLAPFVRDLTSSPVDEASPHVRTTRAPGFKRDVGRAARSAEEALCSVVADVPERTKDSRHLAVPCIDTVHEEQLRTVDDFQAMLCAELLSSLAQKQQQQPQRFRNDGPNVASPSHSTGIHDATMIHQIYQDSEVIDFAHRVSRFAAKTGMTPSLVLSCVLSESLRFEGQPATVVHPERGERGQLSRVLFDIVWRQHLTSCDPSSNVPNVIDDSRRLAVMAATNRKREINDDSAVGHKERVRQEKVQRWKEKKKSRNFAAKIRYPARQHLANARKRHKGQFVSNKVTEEDATESSQT